MRELFQETRIPYLFIDTDIPALTGKLSHIGQDSRQSGVLSGKLMNLLLIGGPFPEGELLLIDPPGSNYHLRERMAGFREYLGDAEALRSFSVLKEQSDSEEELHHILDRHFKDSGSAPAGIFVANPSVYYAASWMEKRGGIWPSVPLIGYALIPGREGFIERGTIDFILTQQPEEQGYKGLMKLYDSQVLGRVLEKNFIIPLNIITRENLHTFVSSKSL
jgi:LacI family transcriptional regulator